MYKCKHCGKEFEDRYKLTGHSTHCKMNPNYENNRLKSTQNVNKWKEKVINIDTEFICQFCGKKVGNKGCLVIHEKSCFNNPNRTKNPNRKGNGGNKKGNNAWNKGLTYLTDDRVAKNRNCRKISIEEGKIIIKGRKHTSYTKEKLRKITIDRISKLKGEYKTMYNKKACYFINSLNEKMGWNLQHAENGGEIEVCGYFLDGYDKNRNIAFEYDERKHYQDVYNNILTKRDIDRQQYIIEYLKCKFYRYNEVLDLFYEVI